MLIEIAMIRTAPNCSDAHGIESDSLRITWFTNESANPTVPRHQKCAAIGKKQPCRQFLQVLVPSDEGGLAALRPYRLVQKPKALAQGNDGLVTI